MKENLDAFYENLGYQEKFGPSEVKSSMLRNQLIYTCAIMEVANSMEIKEILCEDKES